MCDPHGKLGGYRGLHPITTAAGTLAAWVACSSTDARTMMVQLGSKGGRPWWTWWTMPHPSRTCMGFTLNPHHGRLGGGPRADSPIARVLYRNGGVRVAKLFPSSLPIPTPFPLPSHSLPTTHMRKRPRVLPSPLQYLPWHGALIRP